MSDDKQQPRKRVRIPTPEELDESAGGGQSQRDVPQEKKGEPLRTRRFQMPMRRGVGWNKKVRKAPRPDAKPIARKDPPDGQDLGDVESGFSEPSSGGVIGDEGGQILEEAVPLRQIPGRIQPFKDEFSEEDKQEGSSRSRVRTVKFSPKLKKRKEEPVPDDTPKRPKSREEIARDLASRNAQENGHDIGDFVKQVRPDRTKHFTATCRKCGLDIIAVVELDDYQVKGLPGVIGKAKNKRCTGGVGGYSSGTS